MNEMVQHTPGEWLSFDEALIGPNDSAVIFAVLDDEDGSTCKVCEVFANPDVGSTLANKRVIAASPNMLEALEAFEAQYDYFTKLWGEEGVTRGVADKVRVALAKARGK